MARVPYVQTAQAHPEVKELFTKIEANGARILNLYRVAAHSPFVVSHFVRLGGALLTRADLPPKLRELAILRVAKLSRSAYEWTQHVPIAREAGVTEAQIKAMGRWRSASAFTDEERAVLRYTDEVARNVQVSDETFGALRTYLDDRRIVELTLSIGYWGMIARTLVPLQVDIDALSEGKDLMGKRAGRT
ncbi:MAG: carboxymuconolactone decarboxylase family protein [Dehalococcoidia bacterium]|nr:carboxymuconolactone decarboxylase family protein [Dehalococcoidia bacterium]